MAQGISSASEMEALPFDLTGWFFREYFDEFDRCVLRLVCSRFRRACAAQAVADPISYALAHERCSLVPWLLNIGCSVHPRAYYELAKTGQVQYAHLLQRADARSAEKASRDPTILSEAAFRGHKAMVDWCFESGWQPELDSICENALSSGNLELVQSLIERGFALSSHSVCLAAMSGNSELVRWVLGRGIQIQDCTLQFAASGGNLDVVRLIALLSRDRPKTTEACEEAARFGRLEALRLLRSFECPWGDSVYLRAIENDDIEILDFAFQNRCPLDDARKLSAAARSEGALDWLLEKKIPIDWSAVRANCLEYEEVARWYRRHKPQ